MLSFLHVFVNFGGVCYLLEVSPDVTPEGQTARRLLTGPGEEGPSKLKCDHSRRQSIESLLGRIADREGQQLTSRCPNRATAYEFLTKRRAEGSGVPPRVIGTYNDVSEAHFTLPTSSPSAVRRSRVGVGDSALRRGDQ